MRLLQRLTALAIDQKHLRAAEVGLQNINEVVGQQESTYAALYDYNVHKAKLGLHSRAPGQSRSPSLLFEGEARTDPRRGFCRRMGKMRAPRVMQARYGLF